MAHIAICECTFVLEMCWQRAFSELMIFGRISNTRQLLRIWGYTASLVKNKALFLLKIMGELQNIHDFVLVPCMLSMYFR